LVQEPAKPQAAPVQDEWDSQMALGRTALQTGRYPDAEAAFMAALDKVRTAADARLASTLASLADLYAIEGNWEKAVPFATGSLDLLEKLGPSTALNDGLGAAERVAELLSIAEKEPDAANLWARIANLWSGPGQGLPSRAGALTALGFVRRSQGNVVGACQAFQQAVQMGGVGAVAALRGMTATKRETEGREAAQPYLEQLVSEVVNRFGAADVLAKKAIADLRLSYVLGSQREKLAQLERQYKPK
jgi:tetratricopeptide (TPR) repeat protein